MSKAAELAALIGSQTALSNRNLVINGAMTVSQRGDSTGKTATGYYGPDRHALTLNSLGTWSISQSTDTPSGEGFGNSYKLEATTADASPAAGDYAIFLQKIEGQNLQQLNKGTSSAESVTLSFYVRSSKTGTYICEIFDNDNSRSISKSYTISSADTWERKTITFSGDTTGTLGNDNASSLEMLWYLAAGTTYTSGTLQTSWGTRTAANQAVGQVNMADTANATWFITGVQLEVGEQATPFEHRSFGDELARCQRYYRKVNTLNPTYLLRVRGADDVRRLSHVFSTMRVSPTGTIVASGDGTVTVQGTGTDSIQFTVSGQSTSSAPYVADYTLDSEL